MSQFKCPVCGSEDTFYIDSVVLYNAKVIVTPDGSWDYFTNGGDVDTLDTSNITCDACGHMANVEAFRPF